MSNTHCNLCISNLIKREGIYSNDPNDNGKETVFGISRAKNPEWEGWATVDKIIPGLRMETISKEFNVRNFLLIKAHEFYRKWWESLRLDMFPKKIATEIFDTSVNQGKSTAITYLQESLKLITGKNIDVDGIIGPQTIGVMEEFINLKNAYRNPESNIRVLLILLNYFQAEKYVKLVNKDPKQRKFIYGWVLNRLDYTE